jgi:hypothetical protein
VLVERRLQDGLVARRCRLGEVAQLLEEGDTVAVRLPVEPLGLQRGGEHFAEDAEQLGLHLVDRAGLERVPLAVRVGERARVELVLVLSGGA